MRSRAKDLTNQRFGRLVVSRLHFIDERKDSRWMCACDCGTKVSVRGFSLTGGKTQSCGCVQRERVSMASKTHGDCVTDSKTPEYTAWANMIARCTRPSHRNFKDYGGRGITVCKEWFVFDRFLKDMGRRPSSAHSIDRTNNDLGYSKENCRWATKAEQMQNTRRSKGKLK